MLIDPGGIHTNRLEPGDKIEVFGQALVSIDGAVHAVAASASRSFGPYRKGASYRIDAIDAVIVNQMADNANAKISILCLQALNFGDSGLALEPGTAETFIGPEILIPAGTVRPGDIIRQISYEEFSGTLDAGTRTTRARISATTGVDTASAVLASTSTSSTTGISLSVDKTNPITSNTQRRSSAVGVLGSGISASAPNVVTLPDLAADTWLRVSAQNLADTTTQTIFHYSLWLERGGV